MIPKKKKKLLDDIIISSLIVLSPFAFYMYVFFPKYQDLYILNQRLHFVENLDYMIYVSYGSFYFLFVLITWFLTCNYRWKYVILFPLVLEIYKFEVAINDFLHFVDKVNPINSIPGIILILLFTLWVNKKVNYTSSKSLGGQIDDEIDELMKELSQFNKQNYIQAKKQYEQLMVEKKNLDEGSYLKRLVQIRETYLTDK